MRALAVSIAIGLVAAPAAAQTLRPTLDAAMRDAQIRDLQSMADRQAVAQHNELIMLEAQMRTQAALSQVQAQSYRPILPSPPLTGAPPQIDTGRMAQIPDDRLEASNAAVQAVVRSRR